MDQFIARKPVDLLAVVPFALGFHPEQSVVLLAFESRRPGRARAGETFHARVDLPLTDRDRRGVAAMLREVVARHRMDLVGLVLYTDDARAAAAFGDVLVPRLVQDGVGVVDVLRVQGDKYFAVDDASDPGTTFDLSAHPYTAAQLLDGRVAHPSRSAVRESLLGNDEEDTEAVSTVATSVIDELLASGHEHGRLGHLLVDEARWVQRRIRAFLRSPEPLAVPAAGRLLVLVAFDALREVAWAEMSRADARLHVDLWRDLTRRAPDDLRTGAGGLLAFAAWLAGDGALAWCALERCFGSPAEDALARQVASLVETATPPSVWVPIPQSSLRVFQAGAGTAAS